MGLLHFYLLLKKKTALPVVGYALIKLPINAVPNLMIQRMSDGKLNYRREEEVAKEKRRWKVYLGSLICPASNPGAYILIMMMIRIIMMIILLKLKDAKEK
jgi:hypothetical protein